MELDQRNTLVRLHDEEDDCRDDGDVGDGRRRRIGEAGSLRRRRLLRRVSSWRWRIARVRRRIGSLRWRISLGRRGIALGGIVGRGTGNLLPAVRVRWIRHWNLLWNVEDGGAVTRSV